MCDRKKKASFYSYQKVLDKRFLSHSTQECPISCRSNRNSAPHDRRQCQAYRPRLECPFRRWPTESRHRRPTTSTMTTMCRWCCPTNCKCRPVAVRFYAIPDCRVWPNCPNQGTKTLCPFRHAFYSDPFFVWPIQRTNDRSAVVSPQNMTWTEPVEPWPMHRPIHKCGNPLWQWLLRGLFTRTERLVSAMVQRFFVPNCAYPCLPCPAECCEHYDGELKIFDDSPNRLGKILGNKTWWCSVLLALGSADPLVAAVLVAYYSLRGAQWKLPFFMLSVYYTTYVEKKTVQKNTTFSLCEKMYTHRWSSSSSPCRRRFGKSR